ncbi:killer cell lectin-like receptor subfamily G member 1 isoform X2 [Chrysemys picta bellii]|uniref:killer cell lectin-like receptor subfamily G member 1 isoform X2 n=1 Tax=Chrysemys picta bellii TaxID=8478 RepID=UPI000CE64093|nr:killer cell lectin-like receptor subfamily G member 1 isoform X2 [Chrysemys picta bellii]
MAAELRTPEQGPKPWERSVLDSGYGSSIHRRSQRPLDSPEAGEVVVEKFSLSGAECESGPNSPEAAASDSGRSGHVVTSGCSLLTKDEEPGVRVASPEQRSAAGACPSVTRCGTLSPKVRQCPEDWIGFGGNCYYFSTDTKSWDDSKEYCTSRGATLPVIKEKLQLENIKRLRQNHYYWIGLRKEATGWQWDDGSLFTNDVIQLENEDAKLKCSFLNSDKIVTVDCTSSRRWICVKESK